MEQEQEFQVNKLMKKIKKMENDTISKQLTLEQVPAVDPPVLTQSGDLGPVPFLSPLTRTLALSALSCKSPPELASVQGLIFFFSFFKWEKQHSPLLP